VNKEHVGMVSFSTGTSALVNALAGTWKGSSIFYWWLSHATA